jgi:heterodisulfide reductase subunit A-like polyferredoxin
MASIRRYPSYGRVILRKAHAIWKAHPIFVSTGLRSFSSAEHSDESVIKDPRPSVHGQLYGAIVVGGGPAGLATVGTLLDEDVKPILWIDEKFQGGRLSAKYREVPRCVT